jgi:hypothetical protein
MFFLSKSLKVKRGCRQCDQILPYIFILCSVKIRQCKVVKSFMIDRKEYKITHFADDTSLLLDGSEKSLNTALKLFYRFNYRD